MLQLQLSSSLSLGCWGSAYAVALSGAAAADVLGHFYGVFCRGRDARKAAASVLQRCVVEVVLVMRGKRREAAAAVHMT